MPDSVRASITPIDREQPDWTPLLQMVGDARFVLLGEASHGTHEFYQHRAGITRELITELGFDAVAVEADWPDAYRINRFVRAMSDDESALDSLGDFERFPTWMWRNTDVLDFIGWLRSVNDERESQERKVGFYGVDLYSLFSSMQAVVRYLEKVDPDGAKRARQRYACFDHFREDSQQYGYSASLGISESCENEVVEQLMEFRRKASEYAGRDGHIPPDEAFFAEQNARLVANAERYYRSMFAGRSLSWNLRDEHMADTIDALAEHLRRQGRPGKIVVWEHNSHLGDARATQFAQEGQLNVGQLMRERHGDDCRLIGFSTYTGSVTAATDWDGPAERKKVRPGMRGSYEALFHETGTADFYLPLRGNPAASSLTGPLLQRAIGVIYRPDTERMSHYFEASLPMQFDAVIHFDETTAVTPLEKWAIDHSGVPETYPTGM